MNRTQGVVFSVLVSTLRMVLVSSVVISAYYLLPSEDYLVFALCHSLVALASPLESISIIERSWLYVSELSEGRERDSFVRTVSVIAIALLFIALFSLIVSKLVAFVILGGVFALLSIAESAALRDFDNRIYIFEIIIYVLIFVLLGMILTIVGSILGAFLAMLFSVVSLPRVSIALFMLYRRPGELKFVAATQLIRKHMSRTVQFALTQSVGASAYTLPSILLPLIMPPNLASQFLFVQRLSGLLSTALSRHFVRTWIRDVDGQAIPLKLNPKYITITLILIGMIVLLLLNLNYTSLGVSIYCIFSMYAMYCVNRYSVILNANNLFLPQIVPLLLTWGLPSVVISIIVVTGSMLQIYPYYILCQILAVRILIKINNRHVKYNPTFL